jgi:hypothetical protein
MNIPSRIKPAYSHEATEILPGTGGTPNVGDVTRFMSSLGQSNSFHDFAL